MKKTVTLVSLVVLPFGLLSAASDSQTITLDRKLEIPGATLKSGSYTFEVEDRLQDRAIIRITDAAKNSHELLLAVPNEKLNQSDRGKLILFPTANSDKQILEGWMCPSCQTALEVVYPKSEAVKITGISAKPVLAVDPASDKLPKNLSADDMKVVTLWLLSPKEVTANQKGKGLQAAKWADVNSPRKTEVADAAAAGASNAAPSTQIDSQRAAEPAAVASATPPSPEAPVAPQPTVPTPAPAPQPTPQSAQAASAAPAVAPAGTEPNSVAAAPVEISAAPKPAATRRMPHTASSMFTVGFIGLAFLIAGFGLQLQRRWKA